MSGWAILSIILIGMSVGMLIMLLAEAAATAFNEKWERRN